MENKKLIWLYPGQGSQFIGMGKDLAENNPKAKALFQLANDVMGFSLTDVMFNGPEDQLRKTLYTQPAILVTSMALHSMLSVKRTGLAPVAVAGHSLGEVTAMWAAGVFDTETALRLVKRRAELMNEAAEHHSGKMAAIMGLSDEKLAEVAASCNGTVILANYNAPKQTVISGADEAIEEAVTKCKEAGAKRAIVLQVGGAFHSPLMKKPASELAKLIDDATFHAPTCPVFTNCDAKWHTSPDELRTNLKAQMTSSVLWTKIIANAIADFAPDAFVEVGPGNVLAGLLKRIDPNIPCSNIGTWDDLQTVNH